MTDLDDEMVEVPKKLLRILIDGHERLQARVDAFRSAHLAADQVLDQMSIAATPGGPVERARAALAQAIQAPLDMELLAKFERGEGGRRTGELMRRGYIHVTVTTEGRRALNAYQQLKDSDEP